MRDNMLVNVSGLPGHAMGMDLNIEHLIRYLKVRISLLEHLLASLKITIQDLFAAKGIYSNWDRLGNIAASVNYLQLIKKQVVRSTKSGYHASKRKDVDTSSLVWRVANKALELQFQDSQVNREDNASKLNPDLRSTGYHKFESSALGTINKKFKNAIRGLPTAPEVDIISPVNLDLSGPADEHINGDDTSLLHDVAYD